MVTYRNWPCYWNPLDKEVGEDKGISSWNNLACSFQINISGMRVMNYMKKAGQVRQVTSMQQWSSYYRALPSGMFCFTSLLLHQWSYTCEPNQVNFLPLSQQLLYLPHSQLTAFLLPGSQGAAEHMLHVSAASSGKRIHSPTEFTCYLETYSGQCSNLWLHKSHHPTLRKPRTSMTLLSFPNRSFFFECCTSSLLL